MRQTNQAILTQPFEFDEVLVEPKARRSFQHAGALEGAFGTEGMHSLPSNTPTRKLAIRLRTINNACAAPFKTPDGLPVTDVSIYGSRERQFVVGPYWAVVRLMAGTLPSDGQSKLVSTLDELCQALESILGLVDAFLSDPETNSTTARLEKAHQDCIDQAQRERLETTRFSRPISRCPSEEQIEYWVRREQQIDLSVERIDAIREFSRAQHETLSDLKEWREYVEQAPWWFGWTEAPDKVYDHIKEAKSSYVEDRNRLRTPAWPPSISTGIGLTNALVSPSSSVTWED